MIRPAHFTGMSCTVYQRREGARQSQGHDGIESSLEQQLRFRCTTGTHNTSLNAFHLKVCHVLCVQVYACVYICSNIYIFLLNVSQNHHN